MNDYLLQSVPVNSLLTLPPEAREGILLGIFRLPKKVQDILFSEDTGAYTRGLAKSYDVDINFSPNIALAILFIAIGEKSLVQLPAILSTELKLPNDKAHKMATEIEKDVFGPVRGELDEFLRKQKAQSGSMASMLGSVATAGQVHRRASTYAPQNVLNLKELPARPAQKDFPVRTVPRKPMLPALPGRQASSPKFPLPPLPRRSDNEGGSKPIRFT